MNIHNSGTMSPAVRNVLLACAAIVISFVSTPAAVAGELIIHNAGTHSVTCTVDGYTSATGWPTTWNINIAPGTKFYVAQNFNRAVPIINWVDCGYGLRTRLMNITPDGPDGKVVLNGLQTRALNVLLYPYVPSNPNGNFDHLVNYVIDRFQASNPQVLLNAVMNQAVDTYSFTALPALLGPNGYDVIELDTLYMGFVVQNNLVTRQTIKKDAPWPVGLTAVTVNNVVYGIPSWLCMDFIYSFDPSVKRVNTLNSLLQFLSGQSSSRPALVGDFNGSWRIPSIYINAYVQQYGYGKINNALTMPPDNQVINNLVRLASTCNFQGVNNCINNVFHGMADGATEKIFATGNASTDMGFSEQSFYIQLYQTVPETINAIPATWGMIAQPLLFTDAFVTNSSTCNSAPCSSDSQNFTTLMTAAAMKTYIAYSKDLPVGTPARHLLVATQPFWQQGVVQNDPLYQQYAPVLQNGQAFPNNFTAESQSTIGSGVCAALKLQMPNYVCQSTPAAPLRNTYLH